MYEPPEVVTPEQYRYDSIKNSSAGDLNWWTLFNDPIMDTLIAQALRNNQDLRAALLNIDQARTALNIQRAELLPKISGQATAAGGNYQGVLLPDPKSQYGVFGTAYWEIDLWGKLRRLNEAALADYMATEYGVRSLQLALVTEVASTYLLLKEFRSSLRISERTLQLRDSSLRLIQARFDRGYAAEIDLNQAQIQRAIAASAIPGFNRLQLQAQNALSLLTGTSPRQIAEGIDLDSMAQAPDIPVGLPSELLARRPDLLESEQFIVAQNALVGAAIANQFPSLSLTGLFGAVSGDLSALTAEGAAWNATGTLLGPIFHWGQNKRRVEIQRSRLEQAYLGYERRVINAFREVEDALISIHTYRVEVEARRDHVRAAVSAQYLSGERYSQGVTSYLEYLESQRQAFDAQLAYVSTRRLYLNAFIQLYRALGGGWATGNQTPN